MRNRQSPIVKIKREASQYTYLHTVAEINGKVEPVDITIFTEVNGNKYYNHILTGEETKKRLPVYPAQATDNSDGIPAVQQSSTLNVAQGQEEVNGVDNAKLAPYRDAVARIMLQAERDKSYLSKAENALVDIIKDANYVSQGQFDLMKIVTGVQDQLTHEEKLAAQKIANDALGKVHEAQAKERKKRSERIQKAKTERENNERYKQALLDADYETSAQDKTYIDSAQRISDQYHRGEWTQEQAKTLLETLENQQEMIEGVGGIEARKHGYDVIYAEDKISPEFTEYVALTNDSLIPTKPFDELMVEQKGESHESTQTSESGETPQHNDENAEPQQTQAAEGTKASESKQNTNKVELAPGYKTLSGKPLSEADKDDFIIKPDGSMEFGYITEEIEKATNGELKKAPIRLKVGIETGGKGSKGLIHAKRHEKDVQNIGYSSIESFISDIAKNFNAIYKKDNGNNKRPTYTLVKYENDNAKQKHKMAPFYFNIEKDTTQDYLIITSFPPAERYLKSKIKKEHLIYSSPALGATVAPNDNSVSRPASNTVGAGQDVRPTSDKSSVPSTSNVAQGQEEVNGVDNAKLAPYRDAVAQIMSQAGRDKSYLSKAENALMDIIKDANYASQGQFDLMKVVIGAQDQLTHEEMLSAQKIANDALGKVHEAQAKERKKRSERIQNAKTERENNEKYKQALLDADYETSAQDFRILAKEGVKSSGRYVVREARFYDIIKEKNLPTHASKDAHIVASSPNRSLSADTQQNKFFNTISVAELLQGVNDRINDKPYVNPDGSLNYDAKLMGKKKKRKKYSLQPKEDVEEESLKDVVHPQDIIDAVNDIVPIYEKSKFSPNATGDKLYNEHSGAGFSGSYFNLAQYGRILAWYLDKVPGLKNNIESKKTPTMPIPSYVLHLLLMVRFLHQRGVFYA